MRPEEKNGQFDLQSTAFFRIKATVLNSYDLSIYRFEGNSGLLLKAISL